MPRLSGFDFLTWLHSSSPGDLKLIPVIVMSGSDLEQDVRKAYQMGANLYMTKPVNWDQFRERMRLLGILWTEHVKTPVF
jgi:DNA-binding response OmpR family regulator